MKKLLYILILFTLNTQAQLHKMPADTEFFYTYGGTNFEEARDIKETPDKGYIVVGTTSSYGQGNTSVYMIKTDSLGNHKWSSVQGGSQNDWAYAVELTHDSGFFVSGYSNSFTPGYSAYYFKTDKNGNLVWQKSIDAGSWSFIYGSYALPDSGFILCGQSYANTLNNSSDGYLIRIDKNGNTLWTNHYGGIQDEVFNSVCVINNKIYAVGTNASHPTDTAADGWIVKLDMNGNQLQDTFISFGGHQQEILNGITPYIFDQFYICGQNTVSDSNTVNGILGIMDTSFNILVQPIANLAPPSHGSVIIFNKAIKIKQGGVCYIGTKSGGLGGTGVFLLGNDEYEYSFSGFYPTIGGHLDDYGYSGVYTSSGRIITVGSTLSTSDYCANNSLGLEDVFLVRFNSDSIDNALLTHTKYSCFADTLFLWQVSIKNYTTDFNVKLFPNPAYITTKLYITSANNEVCTIKVFSVLGEEVMSFKISSNTTTDIDVSNLSSGTYFIKVSNPNSTNLSTIKFSVVN